MRLRRDPDSALPQSASMISTERFRIVVGDIAHLDFLADFGSQSFIDTYREALSLPDLEQYTAEAFARPRLLTELQDPSIRYLLCADQASSWCGYAKLLPSPPPDCIGGRSAIELQRLYVAPSHKGQGVGQLLLAHAEATASRQGFRTIWLRVWAGNRVAQNLYLKAHYALVGEEPYHVGEDARTVLLMRKPLPVDQAIGPRDSADPT